jgi:hypothetical protein
MEFILFTLFSSLEYLAMFVFIFTWFNFPIREYKGQIFFVIVCLNLASHISRYGLGIDEYWWGMFAAIFVQNLFLMLGFRYVWNIQWFYAGIITLFPWTTYTLIQALIFIVLQKFGTLNYLADLQSSSGSGISVIGFVLQTITVIVVLILCKLIRKFELWFEFVPESPRPVWNLKENRWLFVAQLSSVAITVIFLYVFNRTPLLQYPILLFYVLVIFIIYYLCRKRNLIEYD